MGIRITDNKVYIRDMIMINCGTDVPIEITRRPLKHDISHNYIYHRPSKEILDSIKELLENDYLDKQLQENS